MATKTRTIRIDYIPRDAFYQFHERTQRWACLVCHRRAGKTVCCINDLIGRALVHNKPQARYAYIAPYFRQAKAIAWDYLKQYTNDCRIDSNESELSVTLINGAKIRLFGADNPDALRGQYFDGVVLDEYADMKPRVFSEIIRPALADRKGWGVFIGTPKGRNTFYDIYEAAIQNPKEWYTLTLRASQSKILSKTEIDDMRKMMTKDQAEQELECSFDASVHGAILAEELARAKESGRVSVIPYDPSNEVFTAWDLGFGDATSIWWLQFVGRELRWLEYYEDSGKQIGHYAQIIKSKNYNYMARGHFLPHDGDHGNIRGLSVTAQLRDLGVLNRVLDRETDIRPGIDLLRQTIEFSCFDAKNCDMGLKALSQCVYEWDEDLKRFKDKPRHDWTSHAFDAARYAAIAASKIKGNLLRPATPKNQPQGRLNELSWMG